MTESKQNWNGKEETMQNDKIIRITPESYAKCNNIWNMDKQPQTQKWLAEIKAGIRIPYAYVVNDEFLGEGALVIENSDPHYTIPNRRVYLSRLIVKKEHRNRGIGKILVEYLCDKAKQMGFSEISIGVDKDNVIALHLYQSKGFNDILFEGEDEYGSYVKLLKIL